MPSPIRPPKITPTPQPRVLISTPMGTGRQAQAARQELNQTAEVVSQRMAERDQQQAIADRQAEAERQRKRQERLQMEAEEQRNAMESALDVASKRTGLPTVKAPDGGRMLLPQTEEERRAEAEERLRVHRSNQEKAEKASADAVEQQRRQTLDAARYDAESKKRQVSDIEGEYNAKVAKLLEERKIFEGQEKTPELYAKGADLDELKKIRERKESAEVEAKRADDSAFELSNPRVKDLSDRRAQIEQETKAHEAEVAAFQQRYSDYEASYRSRVDEIERAYAEARAAGTTPRKARELMTQRSVALLAAESEWIAKSREFTDESARLTALGEGIQRRAKLAGPVPEASTPAGNLSASPATPSSYTGNAEPIQSYEAQGAIPYRDGLGKPPAAPAASSESPEPTQAQPIEEKGWFAQLKRVPVIGDVARGAEVSTRQLPQLGYGVAGLIGDTLEKTVGKGAALRDWGFRGYLDAEQKLEPVKKETDDVTVAWKRMQGGDIGAMGDFLEYAIGYGIGQLAETVAVAAAGGALGAAAGSAGTPAGTVAGGAGGAIAGAIAKGQVKSGVRKLVGEIIEKQAESMARQKLGKAAAAAEIKDLAATQAMRTQAARVLGTNTAVLANALGMEAGSIYGEAAKKAQEEGRELTGVDLARIWGTSFGAAGFEYIGDKVGLDLLGGKFPAKSRVGGALAGASRGIAVESGTEAAQTILERIGADKEVFDAEGINEIINASAMGGVMGGGVGAIGGALASPGGEKVPQADAKQPIVIDEQVLRAADEMRQLTARDVLAPQVGATPSELAAAQQTFGDPRAASLESLKTAVSNLQDPAQFTQSVADAVTSTQERARVIVAANREVDPTPEVRAIDALEQQAVQSGVPMDQFMAQPEVAAQVQAIRVTQEKKRVAKALGKVLAGRRDLLTTHDQTALQNREAIVGEPLVRDVDGILIVTDSGKALLDAMNMPAVNAIGTMPEAEAATWARTKAAARAQAAQAQQAQTQAQQPISGVGTPGTQGKGQQGSVVSPQGGAAEPPAPAGVSSVYTARTAKGRTLTIPAEGIIQDEAVAVFTQQLEPGDSLVGDVTLSEVAATVSGDSAQDSPKTAESDAKQFVADAAPGSRRFLDLFAGVEFIPDAEAGSAPMEYDTKRGVLRVNRARVEQFVSQQGRPDYVEQTVFHELVHHAMMQAVEAGRFKASDIEGIWNQLGKTKSGRALQERVRQSYFPTPKLLAEAEASGLDKPFNMASELIRMMVESREFSQRVSEDVARDPGAAGILRKALNELKRFLEKALSKLDGQDRAELERLVEGTRAALKALQEGVTRAENAQVIEGDTKGTQTGQQPDAMGTLQASGAQPSVAFKTARNTTSVIIDGKVIKGPSTMGLDGIKGEPVEVTGEISSTPNSSDLDTARRTVDYDGDATTARRIQSIAIPDRYKGKGLGRALYLAHMQAVDEGGSVILYNSQASDEAAAALRSLARRGLVTIYENRMELMGAILAGKSPVSLGAHAVALTDLGRSINPAEIVNLDTGLLQASGAEVGFPDPGDYVNLVGSTADRIKRLYENVKGYTSPDYDQLRRAVADVTQDATAKELVEVTRELTGVRPSSRTDAIRTLERIMLRRLENRFMYADRDKLGDRDSGTMSTIRLAKPASDSIPSLLDGPVVAAPEQLFTAPKANPATPSEAMPDTTLQAPGAAPLRRFEIDKDRDPFAYAFLNRRRGRINTQEVRNRAELDAFAEDEFARRSANRFQVEPESIRRLEPVIRKAAEKQVKYGIAEGERTLELLDGEYEVLESAARDLAEQYGRPWSELGQYERSAFFDEAGRLARRKPAKSDGWAKWVEENVNRPRREAAEAWANYFGGSSRTTVRRGRAELDAINARIASGTADDWDRNQKAFIEMAGDWLSSDAGKGIESDNYAANLAWDIIDHSIGSRDNYGLGRPRELDPEVLEATMEAIRTGTTGDPLAIYDEMRAKKATRGLRTIKAGEGYRWVFVPGTGVTGRMDRALLEEFYVAKNPSELEPVFDETEGAYLIYNANGDPLYNYAGDLERFDSKREAQEQIARMLQDEAAQMPYEDLLQSVGIPNTTVESETDPVKALMALSPDSWCTRGEGQARHYLATHDYWLLLPPTGNETLGGIRLYTGTNRMEGINGVNNAGDARQLLGDHAKRIALLVNQEGIEVTDASVSKAIEGVPSTRLQSSGAEPGMSRRTARTGGDQAPFGSGLRQEVDGTLQASGADPLDNRKTSSLRSGMEPQDGAAQDSRNPQGGLTDADRDYLAAVERGDLETAQRMVDEAAKASGFKRKAWRGDKKLIAEFDLNFTSSNFTSAIGFSFTTDRVTAENYGTARQYYLDTRKTMRFDYIEDRGVGADAFGYDEEELAGMLGLDKINTSSEEEVNAWWNKWDANVIRIDNIDDSGIAHTGVYNGDIERKATLYIVRSPHLIKSAEPVLRDESGRVIPLSERFPELRASGQGGALQASGQDPEPRKMTRTERERERRINNTVRDVVGIVTGQPVPEPPRQRTRRPVGGKIGQKLAELRDAMNPVAQPEAPVFPAIRHAEIPEMGALIGYAHRDAVEGWRPIYGRSLTVLGDLGETQTLVPMFVGRVPDNTVAVVVMIEGPEGTLAESTINPQGNTWAVAVGNTNLAQAREMVVVAAVRGSLEMRQSSLPLAGLFDSPANLNESDLLESGDVIGTAVEPKTDRVYREAGDSDPVILRAYAGEVEPLSAADYARHAELEAKHEAGAITEDEREEAKGIVARAARAAGFTAKGYHATYNQFDSFDMSRKSRDSEPGIVWFTDNQEGAERFLERYRSRKASSKTPRVIEAWLKPGATFDQEGLTEKDFEWLLQQSPFDHVDRYMAEKWAKEPHGVMLKRMVRDFTKGRTPYQSFRFRFALGEGFNFGADPAGFEIGMTDARDIKSAEPFTGVPLSERFNPESDSILRASGAEPLSAADYARHAELEAKHKDGSITEEERVEAEGIVEKAARAAGYRFHAYHQTSKEAEASIRREGFSLDKGRARLTDEQVPDAFFFKANADDIGVGSATDAVQLSVYLRYQNPKKFANRSELAQWARSLPGYAKVAEDIQEWERSNATEFDRRWEILRGFDQRGEARAALKAELELDVLLDSWRNGNESRAAKGRAIITQALQAEGHDALSLLADEGSMRRKVNTTAVFNPNQIKSAEPFTGVPLAERFDSASDSILRSYAGDPEMMRPAVRSGHGVNIFGEVVQSKWESPAATAFDAAVYAMQDKQIDTKRVVKTISEASGEIDDRFNPYLLEETYHGRAAKRTKDFLNDELRPLMGEMARRGVTLAEFETYLHNRHAEERNIQIAKINPEMPDAGSGIPTKKAEAYLKALPAEKRANLEALAARVDAISKGTRQMLVAEGLEDADTIAAWESAYAAYVPLQREESDFSVTEDGMGTGMGFSVRGSSSRRAMGSDKPVVDILANLAMQREKAITRAEKARVGRAVYGLAIAAPNTKFWLAINPDAVKNPGQVEAELVNMGLSPEDAQALVREPKERYTDPRTGLVGYRINSRLRSSPNVFAVRVGGKDRYVFFNAKDARAKRMVSALKNLDAAELNGLMGAMARVTRYFSAVNTQYNPIFGAVNLTRDVQGALLNLESTALRGQQAKVIASVPRALGGIYSDLRRERDGRTRTGKWAALWEEFQNEGGQTGYRDVFKTSADRGKALETELKRAGWENNRAIGSLSPQGALIALNALRRYFGGILSDYNEAMENAVRLSAYKAAKDRGMSNAQAASLAKNLTVNFNRKGAVATHAGALYAFFNASIQGSARVAETLRSPAGPKIIVGGLILGVVQAIMQEGYDDEDPPEFARERNLIIPIGGGRYLSLPMPLGFHVVPNTARNMTRAVLRDETTPYEAIGNITTSMLESFNPIGHAGWSAQTFTPTPADWYVALQENKDWTGKPIAMKDFNSLDPSPGHLRARDIATPFAQGLAELINASSGGTDYQPGLVSPTPDEIDYVFAQLTGGVGREIQKITQTAESVMTGEELPPYKRPLVGRFYGETGGASGHSSQFYANLRRLNGHEREIKGRAENGQDVAGYLKRNPEANLVGAANETYRQVQKLKKTKRAMVEQGASKESVRDIETQLAEIMGRFNDQVAAMSE